MVDDGRDAEEGRRAPEVLQVPEQEREHEADGETHEPRDEDHGTVGDRSEDLHHLQPFRNGPFLTRLPSRHKGARTLAHPRVRDVADGVVRGSSEGNVNLLARRIFDVWVFDLPHGIVAALLVGIAGLLEHELRGRDEGARHEHGEDGKTDGVVAFDALFVAAWMTAEHVRVVERDAYEEHGHGPAERPEHPLTAVILEVVAQVTEGGGVGQHESRRAEELADYHEEKNEQECLVDVGLTVHDAAEWRTDEPDDFRSLAVGDVLVVERKRRLAELSDLRVRKDCVECCVFKLVAVVTANRYITWCRSDVPTT